MTSLVCPLGGFGPSGARLPGCGDDNLARLDPKLDFLCEPSLLNHELGEADPLGIADTNDFGAHEATGATQFDQTEWEWR